MIYIHRSYIPFKEPQATSGHNISNGLEGGHLKMGVRQIIFPKELANIDDATAIGFPLEEERLAKVETSVAAAASIGQEDPINMNQEISVRPPAISNVAATSSRARISHSSDPEKLESERSSDATSMRIEVNRSKQDKTRVQTAADSDQSLSTVAPVNDRKGAQPRLDGVADHSTPGQLQEGLQSSPLIPGKLILLPSSYYRLNKAQRQKVRLSDYFINKLCEENQQYWGGHGLNGEPVMRFSLGEDGISRRTWIAQGTKNHNPPKRETRQRKRYR